MKVKTLINLSQPSSDIIRKLFDDVELSLDIELTVMDSTLLFTNLQTAYDAVIDFFRKTALKYKEKETIIKNLIYVLSNTNASLSAGGNINHRVEDILDLLTKLENTKYGIDQINYIVENVDKLQDENSRSAFVEYVKLTHRSKILFDKQQVNTFLAHHIDSKILVLMTLNETDIKLNQDELLLVNKEIHGLIENKYNTNPDDAHDDLIALSKCIRLMKENNIPLQGKLTNLLKKGDIVSIQQILQVLAQPKLTEKRLLAFEKHISNITSENRDDIIECIKVMQANGIPLSDESKNLETLLKQENITKISSIRRALSAIKPLTKNQFQIITANINHFVDSEEAVKKLIESQQAVLDAGQALNDAYDNNADVSTKETEYNRTKKLCDKAKINEKFPERLVECIKLIQDAKLSLSPNHLNDLLLNPNRIESLNGIFKVIKPLTQSRVDVVMKNIENLPDGDELKHLIRSINILRKNGIHLTYKKNLDRLLDNFDHQDIAALIVKLDGHLSQARLDVILTNSGHVKTQISECIDKLGDKIRLTDINNNLKRLINLTNKEMETFNKLLESFPKETNPLSQKRLDIILKNIDQLSIEQSEALSDCLKEINGLKLPLTGSNHLLEHLMTSSDKALEQIANLFETLKSKMSVAHLASIFADNIATLSANDGAKCQSISAIMELAVKNNVEFKNGNVLSFFDNKSINVKELLQLDEDQLEELHSNLENQLPQVSRVAEKTKTFKVEMDKLKAAAENESGYTHRS